MKGGSLPGASAALTATCDAAAGYKVNIYTDSCYRFGICHDYLSVWTIRGFLMSEGTPIQNWGVVQDLYRPIRRPEEDAVIKIKAYTEEQDEHCRGNAYAHGGVWLKTQLCLTERMNTTWLL